MHPAEQGDQLAGCTARIARAAVRELIGLHAPTWGAAEWRGREWLGEPDAVRGMLLREMYRQQLAGFLERFGGQLENDEARIIEAVGESTEAPYTLPPQPWSLIHIDYRLDNLLIDDRGDEPAIAVVDWQSVTIGSPAADVAYFLGAGLQPEVRASEEEAILREYHDGLQAAGIEGYDWSDLWNDYRRGTFSGFVVTVVAAGLVQQTERGDEMFLTMARRHARHALDLGAEEFLS